MTELLLIGSGLLLSIATYKLGELKNRIDNHEHIMATIQEKNDDKSIDFRIGWLAAITFMINRM